MNLSRRLFLKKGAIALASAGTMPLWGPLFLRGTVFGAEAVRAENGRKTLICIFQRGAVDGLSMVVPFGDRNYYDYRKEIAIAPPGTASGAEGCLDLDGYFGLHPALAPFLPLYKAGHLAVVHACGSPNATRSHFDAQDFMESGVAGDKTVQTGWLNRTLLQCPEDRASPFRAVAMSPVIPRTLQGDQEVLAIPDLRHFGIAGGAEILQGASTANGFEGMYESAVGDVLHGAGKESFEAIAMLKGIDATHYTPANGASYPPGPFGRSLMQIAQLIKANVGLEAAFAEPDGWDTHANQGGASGQLAGRLGDFSAAIAALYQDLGDRMEDVVILTMSEFGRAARQNGNHGTDHGHATCFFALGGTIRGGRVLGSWPGLAPEQLYENRDLALTTDFRDIFAEIAQKHLGARKLAGIFPNHPIDPAGYRGLI